MNFRFLAEIFLLTDNAKRFGLETPPVDVLPVVVAKVEQRRQRLDLGGAKIIVHISYFFIMIFRIIPS